VVASVLEAMSTVQRIRQSAEADLAANPLNV
jgi:hypothetical protein